VHIELLDLPSTLICYFIVSAAEEIAAVPIADLDLEEMDG